MTNSLNVPTAADVCENAPQVLAPLVLSGFLNQLDAMTFAMEQRLPNFSEQTSKCNELLRKNPELFHLLTDEQINALMRGVVANSELEFAVASKTKKPKDILKGVRIENLNFDDVQL